MEQPNTQFTQQNNQFSQPVQGEQQFQGQQPFQWQQPMMPAMKKPKKLGWIISLVAVGIGILGLVIGGILGASNNPSTIFKDIEQGINANQSGTLVSPSPDSKMTDAKYKVKKGNAFLIAYYSEESSELPKMIVDGKEVSPLYTEQNTKVLEFDMKVKSYYYVVATSDEMTIKFEDKGGEQYLIGKANLIEKVNPIMSSRLIIMTAFIYIVITLIVFIIFLVIFLVKNSKYKKVSSANSL